MKNNVYFVSGIDTDAGKTFVTAYLAKKIAEQGKTVITQKFIQTGNHDVSEDIEMHRRIMGIPFTPEDDEKLTMPEIFSYPASPLLASQIDHRPINFEKIRRCTEILSERYDVVLLEGAGGLMVPLTENLLTIDYIAQQHYPLLFVTSGKLGSVNHTLLSLEAIERRGIQLAKVLYNHYPESADKTILNDTRQYIQHYLSVHHPDTDFEEIPIILDK